MIGMVSLTVAANGKISGKMLEGGLTWTLSAPSFYAVEWLEPLEVFHATVIGKSGKAVITNEIAVAAEDVAAVAGQPPYRRGVVSGWTAVESSCEWTAWQNLWKVEPWKTLISNYAKANPKLTEKVEGGTVTLKIAASGAVTVQGVFVVGYDEKKQKDITYSASCSSVVIPAVDSTNLPSLDDAGFFLYLYFPANVNKNFDGYSGVLWLNRQTD